MKKKLLLTMSLIVALGSSIAAFTACSPADALENWDPWTPWEKDETVEETPCDHILQHYEGKESDCHTHGFRAYDECTLCHKLFIDGAVKTEAEILLDFDYTKHTALKDYQGTPSTCITTGTADHTYCSDCGKFYVGGKEVTESEIALPIDPLNHLHLTSVKEIPATCVSDGTKGHDVCLDCEKIYVSGTETAEKDLVIKSFGEHNFSGGSLECSNCDAYKMLYNGEYYLIDSANRQDFITHSAEGMAPSYPSSNKTTYFNHYPSHCMEISTQITNDITVEAGAREWKITNNSTKNVGTFSRFCYGEGNQPYVGRFLMIFDYSVESAIVLDRLGVKVVDLEGKTLSTANSKLLGKNAAEENNASRVITPNTVYRMMYVVETTAANQIVQIFDCFSGPATSIISNMHFLPLDEAKSGIPAASLIQFSEASASLLKKENCTHAWAEEVAGNPATCQYEGVVAHTSCRQCGRLVVDGAVVESVTIPVAEHNYGTLVAAVASTCTEQGHDAYYQCSGCQGYFNTDKQSIDGIPMRALADHSTGDWLMNADQHWKYCSVCNTNVEVGDHQPGPAATTTSDQVCTVCGYVIQPALGHVHQMQYNAATPATCTTDGNIEYYHCNSCEKNYADQEGVTEITGDVVLTASGHSMTYTAAVAATCTTDGNIEYYTCSNCSEHYADEEGTTLIQGSTVVKALGHSMTSHSAQEATCYRMGNSEAYYECSNCKKYFADIDGNTEKQIAELFTQPMTSHNFVGGKCTNSGCTVEQTSAQIVANSASFLTTADTINPTLLKNPGTWACQTGTNVSASISDNVLKVTVKSNSSDNKNKAFIRILPADPAHPQTAYVGVYMWSFDLKVTAALGSSTEKATLKVGYLIQEVTGKTNYAAIKDAVTQFEVGKTYHFCVIVENSSTGHYVQFNVRNTPNSGAEFEIFNAYYAFYPEQSALGIDRLINVTFAEVLAEELSTKAVAQPQAILPKKEED